jgi:DNA-binding MarR family transcriptional regulator
LSKASHAVLRVYDASLAEAGMTASQLMILRVIERRDGLTLSQLAGEMVMDRASLYRVLTPMMSCGWIMVRDGAAGRARHVFLTDIGLQATQAAAAFWEAAQIRVVQALGAEKWREISAAVLHLAEVSLPLAS